MKKDYLHLSLRLGGRMGERKECVKSWKEGHRTAAQGIVGPSWGGCKGEGIGEGARVSWAH